MAKFVRPVKPKSDAFKRRYYQNALVRHEQIKKYSRLLELAKMGTHLRAIKYYETKLEKLTKTENEIKKKNGM